MPDPVLTPSGPISAALYMRMSTEHQQYSTENQTDAMLRYAKAYGMEIVLSLAKIENVPDSKQHH